MVFSEIVTFCCIIFSIYVAIFKVAKIIIIFSKYYLSFNQSSLFCSKV